MRGSKEVGTLKVHERFVAGSLAGATAQTVIYPMEVLLTVIDSFTYIIKVTYLLHHLPVLFIV